MKAFKFVTLLLILTVSYTFAQFTNIAITTNTEDQSETMIAINPLNSNILLTAWNDFRLINNNSYSKPGYAFSTNSGQTWSEDIKLPPGYTNGFDPSVAFDKYGNAFYCYIASIGGLGPVYISRTTNLGDDWDDEQVSTENESQDKPWITVDNTGGSYDGRLYFSWTDFTGASSKIKFRYSSDQGITFGNELTLSELDEDPGDYAYSLPRESDYESEFLYSVVTGSMPAVAPNGDVFVIWLQGDPWTCEGSICLRKSTDGGNEFEEQITVVNFALYGTEPPCGLFASLPSIVADQQNGNIYISYSEGVSEQLHARFVKSTDNGNTWTNPITVGTGTFQDFSSISVDKSGKITIFYRSSGNTYISESFDEGNSFLPSLKVTTHQSTYTVPYSYHYQGVANSKGGDSYCVWTDLREPNADIYFSLTNSLYYYATQNKSINQNATGINSQRKLVKDSNGDYHLVFASGGEIFHRQSTDRGNTWSIPVHLSTDGGKNNFVSIATYDDFLFVTWQLYNGVENDEHIYTIKGKWKKLSYTNWKSMNILDQEINFDSETNPLPVLVSAENVDDNYSSVKGAPEIMIAFRKFDGIYHVNLFYSTTSGAGGEGAPEYIYNQKGPIHKIPNTSAGYRNPSITANGDGEIMLTCNSSSGILKAFLTTGGNWITYSPFIFQTFYHSEYENSSITSDGMNNFHISWEGYNFYLDGESILHKKIITGIGPNTPISEFTYSLYESYQPSTFGHLDVNGGVTLYWFTENDIKRVVDNGTGWDYSGFEFIPSIQTDANFVSSIDKDEDFKFAYCWTSTGDSPYDYNVSIYEDIPKNNPTQGSGGYTLYKGTDSLKTYRRAEFINPELDVILALQLGNFSLLDNGNNKYPLDLEQLDTNFVFQNFNEALNTLLCDTVPRSSIHRKISFDYNAVFKNLFKIRNSNSNDISIKFKVKDRASGNTLYSSNAFQLPEDSTRRTMDGSFIVPLNGLNQIYDLSVELELSGVSEEYLNQTENINLVNTYLFGSGSIGKQKEDSQKLNVISEFRLAQNFPNPFNPVTRIKYEIPKSSIVTLKIYDVLGREIESLVDDFKPAGNYEVEFDASEFPSGVYFYKLQTENYFETKKMILLK